MFTTIGEIKTAINSFRNDTAWLQKRARWDKDFDLYRLKPYDAGSGYYSYTTNAPRVFINKVNSLAQQANLTIRVPLDSLTEPERTTASNVERFLYGAINLNDKRLFLRGKPTTREQMSWYSSVRGSYFERPYVYKNDKSETVLATDIWDSYNTSYAQGENGLLWAAHTYKAPKAFIKAVYGIDIGTDLSNMIDYWDGKKYCVIVENQWAIPLTEHGLDHCPVYHIQAGDMPPIWQENYQYTSVYQGESVVSNNRNIFPLLSKTISDYLTMVRRGVKVPILTITPDGQPIIEEDIWQVEKAGVVTAKVGTEVRPLIEPSMPKDAEVILQIITGELQRGSLPHSTYGEMAIRLSGYAINQLHQAVETSIMYVLGAVTKGYEIACEELLEQFTSGKFPAVSIRGRTSRNEVFGMPKPFKMRPSSLKGDWRPEIKLEPTLPKDEAEKYYIANLARQGAEPLLSDETILDQLIGIKDTDLETQKKAKQWADKLPILRLWEAFQAALEENRPDVAKNLLAELRRLLGQLGGQMGVGGGGNQGAEVPPPEATELGRNTGLPSSVMPAEQLGGTPPGAQSAGMAPEGAI